MDRGELIELFYNRTYEKFVNKQILDDKNYIVPRQQLTHYDDGTVDNVLNYRNRYKII